MKKWQMALFACLLALDVWTKMLAIEQIPALGTYDQGYPFGGIGIFPNLFGITFSLNFVTNTGAAWGAFASYTGILFLLRIAIIGGLLLYLLVFHRGNTGRFPLWLVVTGAIGNALDYWFYGYVIDFLHFTFWGYSFPIFNLADSYISIGVFLLLLLPRKKSEEEPAPLRVE